jgi:hypothetical protein
MKEIAEQATSFNKNPPIWSSEFSLNGREIIRVELGSVNGTPIVNMRRWYKPPDGGLPRPTRRGLAYAIKHLPDITALMNEAVEQARGLGLLPPDDRADRRGEGGADV